MGIKMNLNSDKQKQIPEEFKDLAKDFAEKGFITTSSDNLINWARTGSCLLYTSPSPRDRSLSRMPSSA